ncbi:hypothetical protein ES689_13590 [Frigoribacterium sp. ACAM 257]|nr:hypothetical protein ES689_13590 [Frigoribacterium sp. ACAM 257]
MLDDHEGPFAELGLAGEHPWRPHPVARGVLGGPLLGRVGVGPGGVSWRADDDVHAVSPDPDDGGVDAGQENALPGAASGRDELVDSQGGEGDQRALVRVGVGVGVEVGVEVEVGTGVGVEVGTGVGRGTRLEDGSILVVVVVTVLVHGAGRAPSQAEFFPAADHDEPPASPRGPACCRSASAWARTPAPGSDSSSLAASARSRRSRSTIATVAATIASTIRAMTTVAVFMRCPLDGVRPRYRAPSSPSRPGGPAVNRRGGLCESAGTALRVGSPRPDTGR